MADYNRASGGRLEGVFGDLLVRRFTVRQPEMYRVVRAVSEEKLTSIDEAALCELAQAVMDTEYEGLEGDFLQAGCGGSGGAAIVMAHAKRRSRLLLMHDPFSGGADIEMRVRGALLTHSVDERLSAQLIAGPYEEKISSVGPLALAHLDCSKLDPMHTLLTKLAPRLVPGGQLIIDDYRNKKECQQAVDDYFRGKTGFRLVRKSRLHVVRT